MIRTTTLSLACLFFFSAAGIACSSSSSGSNQDGGGGGGSSAGDDGGGGGGGGSGGGGGGGGGNALTCDAISWCTNIDPATSAPKNPPALGGGALKDGFYRREEGGGGASALYFQGTQVLDILASVDNLLGTYTVNGSDITFTYDTKCIAGKTNQAVQESQTFTFAVQGDDLFLKDKQSGALARYHSIASPEDVCTEDASFACSGSCSCSLSTGGGHGLKACD